MGFGLFVELRLLAPFANEHVVVGGFAVRRGLVGRIGDAKLDITQARLQFPLARLAFGKRFLQGCGLALRCFRFFLLPLRHELTNRLADRVHLRTLGFQLHLQLVEGGIGFEEFVDRPGQVLSGNALLDQVRIRAQEVAVEHEVSVYSKGEGKH